MDKEKIEYFRRILAALREKITGDYERVVETSGEEFGSELPEMIDEAARTINRRIMLSISDNSLEVLKAVQDALERIEEGEFGVCQECGEDIPLKRLELVPYARFCVQCKEKMEKQGRS